MNTIDGWEWMDDISEVPTVWSTDVIKEVYEHYVTAYALGNNTRYYSTSLNIEHKNIVSNNNNESEVKVIYESRMKRGKYMGKYMCMKTSYTNEVNLFNEITRKSSDRVKLITIDEFIKILDNE